MLLEVLKDICIGYLRYDSIEQVTANGELLTSNNVQTYFSQPRIITTTRNNINERFYNYLLMDWKIQKWSYHDKDINRSLPLYPDDIVNYETEKEKIYGQEITSIRRLVPLKDRPKYFR